MKITKAIQQQCLQFEVNNEEFKIIQSALGDYYSFLECTLKTNTVRSNSSDEQPFPLTDKVKKRFKSQFKTIEPMIEMIHLFY